MKGEPRCLPQPGEFPAQPPRTNRGTWTIGHIPTFLPNLGPAYDKRVLPGVPGSVREARRYLAEVLGIEHPALYTAQLCVSELVTNALTHSASGRGGKVLVAVDLRPDRLRVHVVDEAGAPTEPRVRPQAVTEHGHGLHIVKTPVTRWNSEPTEDGRTTWFELAL